jgi:hypothetical protein
LEAEIRRRVVHGQTDNSRNPISKITRAKRPEGVSQAIEHCFANIKP